MQKSEEKTESSFCCSCLCTVHLASLKQISGEREGTTGKTQNNKQTIFKTCYKTLEIQL